MTFILASLILFVAVLGSAVVLTFLVLYLSGKI